MNDRNMSAPGKRANLSSILVTTTFRTSWQAPAECRQISTLYGDQQHMCLGAVHAGMVLAGNYDSLMPAKYGAEGSKVVARLAGLISLLVIGSLVLGLLSGCDWPWSSPAGSGVPGPNAVFARASPIRFLSDSPTSIGLQLDREAAAQFTRQTGIGVEVIPGASSTSDRLAKSELYLAARSPEVDVYQIDVIWPGILADDLLDLSQYIAKSQIDEYFPAIVRNDTVKGRLVGLPYFSDAGLLYYRTDLFAKYGISGPPQTWDDLEAEANEIQAGERGAGNRALWGFIGRVMI